jgi:hypothetical protein
MIFPPLSHLPRRSRAGRLEYVRNSDAVTIDYLPRRAVTLIQSTAVVIASATGRYWKVVTQRRSASCTHPSPNSETIGMCRAV